MKKIFIVIALIIITAIISVVGTYFFLQTQKGVCSYNLKIDERQFDVDSIKVIKKNETNITEIKKLNNLNIGDVILLNCNANGVAFKEGKYIVDLGQQTQYAHKVMLLDGVVLKSEDLWNYSFVVIDDVTITYCNNLDVSLNS